MGDAKNEVLTTSELAKLKFDPNLYRVNACQGLVYDPMRKSKIPPLTPVICIVTTYLKERHFLSLIFFIFYIFFYLSAIMLSL